MCADSNAKEVKNHVAKQIAMDHRQVCNPNTTSVWTSYNTKCATQRQSTFHPRTKKNLKNTCITHNKVLSKLPQTTNMSVMHTLDPTTL